MLRKITHVPACACAHTRTHAEIHKQFCFARQCDSSSRWRKRRRAAVTSVKLHPGETNAVTMRWVDESPCLAPTVLSVSRFLGNDGAYRSVNVMRSRIGPLRVSRDSAPPSYWHVSPYTSWLAITSPSTSITNPATPGLFAWQSFNGTLWEDGERSARYESQTVQQLWHCDTCTLQQEQARVPRPSSKR